MMKLTLFLRLSAAIFVLVVLQSSTVTIVAFSFGKETSSSQHPRIEDEIGSPTPSTKRRDFLSQTTSAIVGTCTASLLPSSSLIGHPLAANALVDIEQPPSNNLLVQTYDKPRNDGIDKIFSNAMATGMAEYETKARPYKAKLFQTLFDSLALQNTNDNNIPTIVEVGMGTFPNAPYYAAALLRNNNKNPQLQQQLQGLDIVGVDPNNSMFEYAKESATRSGLISTDGGSNISLRNVHGVAEVLPFASNSIDAVGKLFFMFYTSVEPRRISLPIQTPTYTHISLYSISPSQSSFHIQLNKKVATLTLCSVTDQQRALSEIQRVLKPNTGKYLFWEHVLSEDDSSLAIQQRVLSPIQTFVADGCHLNRRTGMNIVNCGLFRGGVKMEYVTLDGGGIIGPTVFGIATV